MLSVNDLSLLSVCSAWVSTEEDPEGLLASLNRKAMALSNLTLETAELLQVGQFRSHEGRFLSQKIKLQSNSFE